MEAQIEIQNYLEQGCAALAQGQAREAAIAFANGAQLEPNSPAVHLGLAEANLALGNYPVVKMASHEVIALQPEKGCEAQIAQALLDLLDHRYLHALQAVDAVISMDPSIAYVHALRSYLLRANGQDYDANLARARATRLSYGGRFENCFPPLEPAPVPKRGYDADPGPSQPTVSPVNNTAQNEREMVPNWSRPSGMRRRAIRTGFFLSQNPGFITNAIIAIIAVLYLLSSMSGNFYNLGGFDFNGVLAGQVWRFVTSLFMYPPDSLLSVLVNMLALFFIGRVVEMFYGPYRYLTIYLLVGVLSNIVSLVLALVTGFGIALGPLGPLMGVFGAIGFFYFVNRRGLGGFGASAIMTWMFWVILNLGLAWFAGGPSAVGIELFCILMGMVLAYFFFPRSGRGHRLM